MIILDRLMKKRGSGLSIASGSARGTSTTHRAMGIEANEDDAKTKHSTSSMTNSAKSSINALTRSRIPSVTTDSQIDTSLAKTVGLLRDQLQADTKGSAEENMVAGVTSDVFLDFISTERLRQMPTKGSRWDKILKWSEDFAPKLSLFVEALADKALMPDSIQHVAGLCFASLQILLCLGPNQAEALELAFSYAREYGLTLDMCRHNVDTIMAIPEARQQLGLALADMITHAVNVALFYRNSVRTITNKSIVIDFDWNATFGDRIGTFIGRRQRIADLIWAWKLKRSSDVNDLNSSVETVCQWLQPHDRRLHQQVWTSLTRAPARAEFTCEWFDRPLTSFLGHNQTKDRLLTVTAEAGAGKTFLFGWILERLQRHVGGTEFQVIHTSIDGDIPSQASILAMLKAFILQLLEQNVGNAELFSCLAHVTTLGDNTTSDQDTDGALWYTLETALKVLNHIVIVIDGLEALEGDDEFIAFNNLHQIASKNALVKVIILSRPAVKPWQLPSRKVPLDASRTTTDVKHIAHAYLNARRVGTQDEADEIVTELAKRSNGSLTWTDMALQLLEKVGSVTDILKTVKELPGSMKDMLDRHLGMINIEGDGRLILSWLLVTERPFTFEELQAALEMDVEQVCHQARTTNVVDDIRMACGYLVTVRDDKTVRFRNEAVRQHLLDLSTTQGPLMSIAEANKSLAMRLLLYVQNRVTRNMEPSIQESMTSHDIENLFLTHSLLDYTSRHWLHHLERSCLFVDGKFQPADDDFDQLKAIFPTSTLLVILERHCWNEAGSIDENKHLLALTIRKQVVGQSALCILQGCINAAIWYQKYHATSEASQLLFEATKVGQALLGPTNDLTAECATVFLDLGSETEIKVTTRSDSIDKREEILLYLIEMEKQRSGSPHLIRKYRIALAQLYTDVQENNKAETVYRELYQASVSQSGELSQESTAAANKLHGVLYKEEKHEDVVQYTQPIFESAERELDIFDIRRVEITLRMADTYEKQDPACAEELYVATWRGLTEYCDSSNLASEAALSEANERKVQICIAYARFLRRQARTHESQDILYTIWLEYHDYQHKPATLIKQLNTMGEELYSMGMLDTAIAVFKSVWSYFKSSGEQRSDEAVRTAISLVNAVQLKSNNMKSQGAQGDNGVSADTSSEDEEANEILSEVARAVVNVPNSSAEVPEVNIESSIQTCQTLSAFYTDQERWSDAIDVCVKILSHLWPELFVARKSRFPKEHTTTSLEFARRLAGCYARSNQTEQAEKVYSVIFHSAIRSVSNILHNWVTESANTLVGFLESKQQRPQPLTVSILYKTGDMCVKYRLAGADVYYHEITKNDTSADGVLGRSALHAALALKDLYYQQKLWAETRAVCSTLWITITKRSNDYGMKADVVESTYQHYRDVLENHAESDARPRAQRDHVRAITLQYRDTCFRTFGAESKVATSASLAFADVCQKSPDAAHQEEAIKICEDIIAKADSKNEDGKPKLTVSKNLVETAKRNLASLYVVQTQNREDGEPHKGESVDKVQSLWREQLESNKKQYGVLSEVTLGSLSSLIGVRAHSYDAEDREGAMKELGANVVEVLSAFYSSSTPINTKQMYDCAIALANTYLTCGFASEAWALLRQLRTNILTRGNGGSKQGHHSAHPVRDHHGNIDRRRSSQGDDQIDQLMVVERALFALFFDKVGRQLKSQEAVVRILFKSLIAELGRSKHVENLVFVACVGVTNKTRVLLEEGSFATAADVSNALHRFLIKQDGFKESRIIPYGFKLALHLAGLGFHGAKPTEEALQNKMLTLSKCLLRDTLAACKTMKIDLVSLQAREIDNLIHLMGEQKNYDDLEWFLTQLWQSRVVQKSWDYQTVIAVGKRLGQVLALQGKHQKAIDLLETMTYNLTGTHGLLCAATIEVYNLVSTLYIASDRAVDAMDLHKDILDVLLKRGEREESSTDGRSPCCAMKDSEAAEMALGQLYRIRSIYAFNGGWPQEDGELLTEICVQIVKKFSGDAPGKFQEFGDGDATKWETTLADPEEFARFRGPAKWDIGIE
ncbi:nacht domain protein [Apiospora kogelbergensis]|uniref:nacht domain protein n=1 Tax=Apiospora kogelbergensis TaxID=1337665 RepID=UPI0031317CA6